MRYILFATFLVAVIPCNSKNNSKDKIQNEGTSQATIKILPIILTQTDSILSKYDNLKMAFVEADTTEIDLSAIELSQLLKNYSNIIDQDSSLKRFISNEILVMHLDADSIISKKDLTQKKRSFNSLSDTFFTVLQKIQYSGQKIYKQKCPMAFNDAEAAHWLSKYSEIENPYLGKKHPKYGSGMLHCGELFDSLNYKR